MKTKVHCVSWPGFLLQGDDTVTGMQRKGAGGRLTTATAYHPAAALTAPAAIEAIVAAVAGGADAIRRPVGDLVGVAAAVRVGGAHDRGLRAHGGEVGAHVDGVDGARGGGLCAQQVAQPGVEVGEEGAAEVDGHGAGLGGCVVGLVGWCRGVLDDVVSGDASGCVG